MKRILSIISVLLTATILSGSGNKASVWTKEHFEYKIPPTSFGEFDSIPTTNYFGRVRNGIIVDNIISVYNADPNGVDLTETQIEAFRMLVGGMYTTGTWQKCRAIYPFIGGSEYKHKWNIKDLRDLDVAFRLVYSGTITHSSNGMIGNGINGSANTFLLPQTSLNPTSSHLSFYSGTESTQTTNPIEIGSRQIGGSLQYGLSIGTGSPQRTINSTTLNSSTYPTQNVNTTLGFFLTTRTGTTLTTYSDRNNFINVRTGLNNSVNITYGSIRILSYTNASDAPERFSNRQCRFASIGLGLTDTESIRFTNIVTQVQRHLNRQ